LIRGEKVAAGAEKALSGRLWGITTITNLDKTAEALTEMLQQRLRDATVPLKRGGQGL
jgi:hypothetical protein